MADVWCKCARDVANRGWFDENSYGCGKHVFVRMNEEDEQSDD